MAQPWATVRLTADDNFVRGPLIYHGALLQATSGGTATAEVRDGTSASGQLRDALRTVASEHDFHAFDAGLLFDQGIFGDLGSNVDVLLVFWEPYDPSKVEGVYRRAD